MYNKRGCIYFINLITCCREKKFLELPFEIRKIIWKYLHSYPFISCYICDKLLINFEVRIDKINGNVAIEEVNNNNYTIINGITKCSGCFVD